MRGRSGNGFSGATGAAAALLLAIAPAAQAAVSFQPKQDFPASNASGLTAGDFSGDGVADVATSSVGTTTISVLLGNGDGTLQPQRNTTGPSQQSGIAAGDFNGDGRDDAAVVNIGSDQATRFLSQGDGTFGPGEADLVGDSPQDVVAARLDGDSDLDLAVAAGNSGDQVNILLNDGSGSFSSAGAIPHVGIDGFPDGVVAADFDADGDNDLAIGTVTGPGNEVAFARNQGPGSPGTFDAFVELGTVGQKLAAGDFNNDGRPDIAAARTANGDVAIILRNAANTGFDPATTFDPIPAVGSQIGQITAADLDGDGNVDLALPNPGGPQADKVTVATGRGNGLFDVNSHELTGTTPREVVVADFNRDGNPDLATSNSGSNDVSVLLAVPPVPAITPTTLTFGDRQPGSASAEQRFTVRNEGAPRLRIGTVGLGGLSPEQFSISSDGCTGANLAVGESCEVGATFQPSGTGEHHAAVTVPSNGAGAPHVVALTGTGRSGDVPPPLPGACANPLDGTRGPNRLNGTAAGDDIFGLAGNDVLRGLAGDDCIAAGPGDDRGNGGLGDDRLNGGRGADRMAGSGGGDVVNGAGGDDRLSGGPGRNRLKGGSGDDKIDASNGARDRVRCGPGRDKVSADPRDRLKRCERV